MYQEHESVDRPLCKTNAQYTRQILYMLLLLSSVMPQHSENNWPDHIQDHLKISWVLISVPQSDFGYKPLSKESLLRKRNICIYSIEQ